MILPPSSHEKSIFKKLLKDSVDESLTGLSLTVGVRMTIDIEIYILRWLWFLKEICCNIQWTTVMTTFWKKAYYLFTNIMTV